MVNTFTSAVLVDLCRMNWIGAGAMMFRSFAGRYHYY